MCLNLYLVYIPLPSILHFKAFYIYKIGLHFVVPIIGLWIDLGKAHLDFSDEENSKDAFLQMGNKLRDPILCNQS